MFLCELFFCIKMPTRLTLKAFFLEMFYLHLYPQPLNFHALERSSHTPESITNSADFYLSIIQQRMQIKSTGTLLKIFANLLYRH